MDDCQFCTEFNERAPKTRIITEADGWVLLPTIGCLTPGYTLFMPLEHLDAAADFPATDLHKVEASLETMRALVQSHFGPAIVAEHGPRDCERGASCCSHVHLHIIPVKDADAILTAYEEVGGPSQRLDSSPTSRPPRRAPTSTSRPTRANTTTGRPTAASSASSSAAWSPTSSASPSSTTGATTPSATSGSSRSTP